VLLCGGRSPPVWAMMQRMATVLVIEDDDRIRLSLLLALEDEGYAVHGARHGRGRADPPAAGARRTRSWSNLMLPGLDGFDCIRELRRHDDVPIVVVSARADTHDIVAALEGRFADDYLVKTRRGEGD